MIKRHGGSQKEIFSEKLALFKYKSVLKSVLKSMLKIEHLLEIVGAFIVAV